MHIFNSCVDKHQVFGSLLADDNEYRKVLISPESIPATSTGWALGSTAEDAEIRAWAELLERNFLCSALQNSGAANTVNWIDKPSILKRFKLDIDCLVLGSTRTAGWKVAAVAIYDTSGIGPWSTFGTGSGPDYHSALVSATAEAYKARLWAYSFDANEKQTLNEQPDSVGLPHGADRLLFYSTKEGSEVLRTWFKSFITASNNICQESKESPASHRNRLKTTSLDCGIEPISIDLEPVRAVVTPRFIATLPAAFVVDGSNINPETDLEHVRLRVEGRSFPCPLA